MKKQKPLLEVDASNVTQIKLRSMIKQGTKQGKVVFIEKMVRFLYDLYVFTLDNGDVIKIVKA